MWGHSGGTTAYAPEPVVPVTVSSVWAGNVTDVSATVKARSTDATSLTLRFDNDPDLAHPTSVAGSEGNDDVFSHSLTGLDPDTRYYYRFVGSDVTGTFRTFPAEGDTYSFSVATASCAGHSGGEYVTSDVSNAPTFDVIRAKIEADTVLGFMHLGDRHYRDINTNSPSSFRSAYNDVMAASKQLLMHQAGWVDYVWNDHDYGANDSGSSSASKPAAQSTYREHVPHWTLPVADSIQHTYVIGRVPFIHVDDRSYRSSNGATDNSSKTILGATQKQWLKDTIVAYAAIYPVICVDIGTPWNGTASTSWGVFSTERNELTTYFAAEGVTSKLFFFHGDNHFLAFDDGTNAPGGIPTANFSGLDAGFTANDGTWSAGIFKSEQQQYGTLTFTDTGSQITVTAKGYSVNSSGIETERFSEDVVYTG